MGVVTMCIYASCHGTCSNQRIPDWFRQSPLPDIVLKAVSLTVLSSVANNVMENFSLTLLATEELACLHEPQHQVGSAAYATCRKCPAWCFSFLQRIQHAHGCHSVDGVLAVGCLMAGQPQRPEAGHESRVNKSWKVHSAESV